MTAFSWKGVHSVAPSSVTARHVEQVVDPSCLENVPAEHGKHVDDPSECFDAIQDYVTKVYTL
jgi:hypothetical protein